MKQMHKIWNNYISCRLLKVVSDYIFITIYKSVAAVLSGPELCDSVYFCLQFYFHMADTLPRFGNALRGPELLFSTD